MSKLYSTLKVFNFPDHLRALRERRLIAPVHIRIKPINRCNHDCWYCSYRVSNLQLGEDMDLDDVLPEDKMFEIVDDVVDMGVRAVTFSGGGEPLLYKALPEVIRRLAEGGVRVASLSNGSNLKGKMADAFAEHATWIRISVDGWDGPSYAAARNVKEDTFDKLIANMRDFVKRGSTCVLGVSFIVGENNHEHLYEVCQLFKDVGVNHVKLSGVVVGNEAAQNNAYHAKLTATVAEQIEKCKTLADDRFTILDHYHTLPERFERPYHFCPNIQFIPVIGADQMVYTCHDKAFTEGGKLGSIKDRSFKDFWLSEENRQRVFSIDPAVDCPHHCADHAKNMVITDFLSTDEEHSLFV